SERRRRRTAHADFRSDLNGTGNLVMNRTRSTAAVIVLILTSQPILHPPQGEAAEPALRVYQNRLTPIVNPAPLLADYPQFIEPIVELRRFEAPRLIDDPQADLSVRGWRFSYNARGVIEIPNRLDAAKTAVI